MPQLLVGVPDGRRHRRLEHREVVEVVAARDRPAVLEDLPPLGVVAGGHVAHLVEQRQVVVRDDVARDTRVAVPVPGAADVAAALDDADRLDADLAQAGRGQQRREAATDEQHLDLVVDRVALDDLLDVGIGRVASEVARELGSELRRALGPVGQAEVALLGEPPLDLVVVVLVMFRRHRMTLSQVPSHE